MQRWRGEGLQPWGLAGLAIAVLALILAVVAPAIGGKSGPSTKKLAKQLHALQAQVSALQLQQGPPGPEGPQGPQGATGAQGPRGPGAVKVDFDHPNTDIGSDSSYRTVATIGELTVKAYCAGGAINTYLKYALSSTVAAGVNGTFTKSSNGATPSLHSFGQLMSPGQNLGMEMDGSTAAISNGYERDEFSGVYRSATRVMTLELMAIANDGSNRCQLTGSITPTG